jgi:hypothetical protein
MTAWKNTGDFEGFANAEEITIATRKQDGTLRTPRIIWVVRIGDDLYARSVNGRDAAWFRGVQSRHEGEIRTGNLSQDVSLVEVNDLNDEIDAAYWDKYRQYPTIDPSIVRAEAQAATLRVDPR